MDGWITVVVALIVAFSTLGATYLQNRQSNKRFQKELERAREADERQRRREVRSEPLLKLRAELAIMSTKLERVAARSSTYLELFGTSDTEETKEKGKELRDARDNWDSYLTSGILREILFLQSDNEVINGVEEILEDYKDAYGFFENYWDTDFAINEVMWEKHEAKLSGYRDVFERNRDRIIKIQELINKRLEKL